MRDQKNNTPTLSLEATHNLIYEAKKLRREISEIIKGANEYPEEFSRQARARIEAEKLKARNQLEQQRNQVPWSGGYLPRPADEENLRKYILRVFLVFAQEACKLGSRAQWTVDRIRSEADEFLRRFTIEAYSNEGYDKQGRKLPKMTDYGSIKEEVRWAFKESAEWHQFEQELLAVAEQQTRGSPQSSGKVEAQIQATITGTSPKLRDEMVANIIRKNPDASYVKLCEILDSDRIPTLKGWEPLWSETLSKDIKNGRTRVKKHIGTIRKLLGLTKKKRIKT